MAAMPGAHAFAQLPVRPLLKRTRRRECRAAVVGVHDYAAAFVACSYLRCHILACRIASFFSF